MTDTGTDIRTLLRGGRTAPDSAAVAHVVVSTTALAIGAAAAVAGLASLAFPAYIPLGYGVIRAVTMLALLVGFGILSVVGGAYYVLPRLTAAPLWNERLAWAGLVITAVSVLAGIVVVVAGLGDGGEPFGLPWWVDLPLLVGLTVPALVAVQTVRRRSEPRTYITIHFVLTGLVALPFLYLGANLPGLTSLATGLGNLFLSSALPVAGIILPAIGLAHYAVVKKDRPLAGRQLAWIAFWSLVFGAGWFGVAQLAAGPIPGWLGAVSGAAGLAFPVGMIAALASILATIEGSWRSEEPAGPVLLAAVAGAAFGVVVAITAALAGFRSTATLVGFTPFWEGINYALALGVIPLLLAAWVYQGLPRISGRALFEPASIRRQVRLTLWGAGSVLVLLVLGGLVTGFTWAGASFTGAFAATGESWDAAVGPARGFVGLAVVGGIVAAIGNFMLVATTFSTLTKGTATTQEVLVSHGGDIDE